MACEHKLYPIIKQVISNVGVEHFNSIKCITTNSVKCLTRGEKINYIYVMDKWSPCSNNGKEGTKCQSFAMFSSQFMGSHLKGYRPLITFY